MISLLTSLVLAAAPAPAEVVQSFVATHCKSCHSGAKPKGSLSLEKHDAASIASCALLGILITLHSNDSAMLSGMRGLDENAGRR